MSNFYTTDGAALSSSREDWETPQEFFNALNARFHFDIDAAASHHNAKLAHYWTIEDDALKQNWGGKRVYVNPPYNRHLREWVAKASEESKKAGTLIVMLIPARTDTSYFHDFIYKKARVEFLRGRLKYELNGSPREAAPFPSMLVIWDDQRGYEVPPC